MKQFGLLPKCLRKIFSEVSHFACNSRQGIVGNRFSARHFASAAESMARRRADGCEMPPDPLTTEAMLAQKYGQLIGYMEIS